MLCCSALLAVFACALPADAMAPLGMARAARAADVIQTVEAGLEPVLIDGRLFRLERAVTPAQWEKGLMDRTNIASDGGMIFVYPFAQSQSFWMANCLVDMDILFLDARARIVNVHEMSAEPPQGDGETTTAYHARLPRYTSKRPAQFAIELRAGSAKELGIGVGETVHFDRARLARMAR